MKAVQRILPYTKQLVLYALYDVLDSEESEYDKTENGCIAAEVTVYGNTSGFALSVSPKPPLTLLTVEMTRPCPWLSPRGRQRAADYLADRVEQMLENELKGPARMKEKVGNQT